MNNKVKDLIKNLEDELIELSGFIYDNPELGFDEYKSSKAHMDILKKYNFDIEDNFIGFETAFRARYEGEKEGPTIGYMVEYDALPGMGHGCGHNILGTASTGAGIVLSKLVDEIGGTVIVYGTPAEETNGVKVNMADEGVFEELDVAMMSHPGAIHEKSGSSLTLYPVEFKFKGKSSHASSSPEEGINALDACIQTFNNINASREHLLETTRIHGVILEGGEAPNIVPDEVIARFHLRTPEFDYLDIIKEKAFNCAKAGALASGAEVEITNYENPYLGLVTNETLSEVYMKHLQDLGLKDDEIEWNPSLGGSLDMGNVSEVCPSIHPYFAIAPENPDMIAHTKEFADATLEKPAYKGMKEAIYSLTMTGVSVIKDKELLENINEEFRKTFG